MGAWKGKKRESADEIPECSGPAAYSGPVFIFCGVGLDWIPAVLSESAVMADWWLDVETLFLYSYSIQLG